MQLRHSCGGNGGVAKHVYEAELTEERLPLCQAQFSVTLTCIMV